MKRHLAGSGVTVGRRKGGGVASPPGRQRNTFASRQQAGPGAPLSQESSVALRSVTTRNHTLVLTGVLHSRSAHALEAEIERLCDEGVTGITLDLRELSYIDSTGVAVIAFRCGLCKRRGYDFAVVPGSRFIQRAFEQAGVTELLPFEQAPEEAAEIAVPRLRA